MNYFCFLFDFLIQNAILFLKRSSINWPYEIFNKSFYTKLEKFV